MCNFYDLKGEPTDRSHFIKIYRKIYNERFEGWKMDRVIEEILIGNQKLDRDNLEIILRWKTGDLCFDNVIYSSWNRNNNIEVGKVWEKLKDYLKTSFSNPFSSEEKEICINILKDLKSVRGLGITYAIAILYFMSNGKYPIYDRFAQIAVTAILNDQNFKGDTVLYVSPGQSIVNFYDGAYKTYYKDLKSIFGDDYTSRDVDKALWVYGHLFKNKQVRV